MRNQKLSQEEKDQGLKSQMQQTIQDITGREAQATQ